MADAAFRPDSMPGMDCGEDAPVENDAARPTYRSRRILDSADRSTFLDSFPECLPKTPLFG